LKTVFARLGIFSALAAAICLPAIAQQSQVHFHQSVTQAGLAETLTPTVNGNSLQLTTNLSGRTVASPTGTVVFTITSSGGATQTSPPIPLSGLNATWTATDPADTYSSTAVYSGDINYSPENAAASGIVVTMTPDFDFTLPTAKIIKGQTWDGNVQIIPINGFTGNVTFSCGTLPEKVSCSVPATADAVSGHNASPPSATLAVGTVAETVTTSALPFFFLLGLGDRRRKKLAVAGLAFASLLCLAGCGAIPHYLQDDGTPPGTYQIVITGSSGALHHSKTLTVIVTK
jgi:hypothetical protein